MKIFLILAAAAAAAFTLLCSPTARKRVLKPIFSRDFPLTPYDFEPKYAIGGRYVTREDFENHPYSGRPNYEDSIA